MTNSKVFACPVIGEAYEKVIHSSGLTVYFMKKQEKAKKAAMIAAKFGSINYTFTAPDGRRVTVPNGTAHFLEHKLFEGEKGNAFDFYAKTGAKANAYTSNDKTAYYFVCSDHFEENLDVLLSFVTHPYLTKENVEKEKGIIAQEIKMYEDEPGWQGYFTMVQGLYQEHPIRRDIAGTVEDIYSLTPEILMDCYNTFYHPSNLVMAVVGDVDKNVVFEAIDRYFPGNTDISVGDMPIIEPDPAGERYVEKAMLVSRPIFHLGFKDNDTDVSGKELSKKEMEVDILLEYLFGKSSPFFKELYESGVINHEFDCWYDLSDYFSFCVINGESDDPKKVERCAFEHISELKRSGIDEERFREIRNGLYGSLVMETDQAYSMANRMVGNYLNGAETFDAIEVLHEITTEDLQKRAEKMFAEERSCLSVIYPLKEE
ncbi:MAG: insulinase family protein [Clostridia bacterium]|nr:insulinase family protein [Clostridia bacterium]